LTLTAPDSLVGGLVGMNNFVRRQVTLRYVGEVLARRA
jgi:hypothetical protein